MKGKWQKPELVVLIKVQSNEMVLGDCKVQGAVGPVGAEWSGLCMNVGAPGADKACRGHGSSVS
jgi:hypothetical protein